MSAPNFCGPLAADLLDFATTLKASAAANKTMLTQLRALDRAMACGFDALVGAGRVDPWPVDLLRSARRLLSPRASWTWRRRLRLGSVR